MRVLQIVPSISLIYGGPSQMVLGLSQALAEAGTEVTILTTDANGDTGQAPLEVPLGCPVAQDGFEIYYFRCAPFRRYKFSIDLLRWLAQYGRAYDLAHVHALFSPVSTAAATVARTIGLPYLLRPLGTLDPADLRKKRQIKQLYGRLLERPNLAGAAAVHFTSQQEARISERFGLTTHDLVIPLGVSLPQPQGEQTAIVLPPSLAADTPRILFMSRIDPKKGLDLLIPALEQLQAEGLPFHFVLAGGNPQDPAYEQTIHRQIQTSPLADRTTITGFVSGQAKLALLQQADLFVLPSYYENFGIAVAEAMAVGLPVVISDQVHIWDAVQQAEAGWVSECDRTSLTDSLRYALKDREERQRRGENARRYALEYYSWPAIARQMQQAYSQILSGTPSPN